MRWIFLGGAFIFLSVWAWAQSPATKTVRITRIAPTTLGERDEWLEIEITSQGLLDIADWTISNGSSTKKFKELPERLHLSGGTSFSSLSEEEMVLDFGEGGTVLFYGMPSWVSLPDGGSLVEIRDENGELLDQATYPDTRKGTVQGRIYTEVWHRYEDREGFYPLRVEEGSSFFTVFPGGAMGDAPIRTEDLTFLLSEASPKNRENDFLEFRIAHSGEEKINLKYFEVKHNGTSLFVMAEDFWVSPEDFIGVVFDDQPFAISSQDSLHILSTDKRPYLSGGSGTVEVILWSGTSWETVVDVACWMDETLSQTESDRVEKYREEDLWRGDCIDISSIIENESVARYEPLTDTDQATDFFRHFNGSLGRENDTVNAPPVAQIVVQGSRRIYKGSLNFTGDTSTDPDGSQDLKSYLWTINTRSCPLENDTWRWYAPCDEESTRANPNRIYFDEVGRYEVCLRVTDRSDETDTQCVDIEVTPQGIDPFRLGYGSGASSSQQNQVKRVLKKELEKAKKEGVEMSSGALAQKYRVKDDFFDDFFNHLDGEVLSRFFHPDFEMEIPDYLRPDYVPPDPPLFRRDYFTPEQRRLIKKNIGLIYTLGP